MAGPDESAIRVVHVDDEPGLAKMAGLHLERHDERLDIEPETDAATAFERLQEDGFDCVISDYEMPRMDGLDLLEEVRAWDETFPFILFTGKGSEAIASEAIAAGVTDYLQKESGTEQYEVLANRVTNAVDHVRAERRALRSYRALNTAWDGIALLDADGEFVFANGTYAATVGRPQGSLEGTSWAELYPDDDAEEVHETILPAIAEGATWTDERELELENGERLLVKHAIAGIDGGGAACVIRDVTEQRDLHRQLERERERFRLLVESVDEYAIFLLGTGGDVQSWNDGAERIKGYEPQEVLGEHYSMFYPEEARAEDRPAELLATAREEGVARDEGWRVRADGTRFWADVTITALREDGEVTGFAKITKDRTDEREREERRRRNDEARRKLYRITTDPGRDFEDTVGAVLRLGAEHLGVENAIVSRVDVESDHYEIARVAYGDRGVTVGDTSALTRSYCRKTIDDDHLLGVYNAEREGWADDPAFERWGLGCYLGSPLEVDGEVYGTVCFVDGDPREEPFRHDEKAFVELVARWLTFALWRRDDELT